MTLVAVLSGLCVSAGLAGGPGKPEGRPLLIPIEPLGFQTLPMRFMSTGSTLFTLHFVDEGHLLFTFTTRKLLTRLADAEPDDDDRNVTAELLELPTGKVLAETDWRTRDRDRYLWPLEHGRFLLRVRTRLMVIDPLRNYEAGGPEQAFKREDLLDPKRPIGYVSVATGGDLLAVETVPPRKPKLVGAAASAAALATTVPGYKKEPELQIHGRPPVQINFYRLKPENEDGSGKLVARSAGTVGSQALIVLPATADGYLDIKQDSQQAWTFDFVSHTGKRLELGGYETSCAPRPYFVSRSEFVAFGCRGATERVELSYFNFKGEQPWLSVLGGSQVSPAIIGAPAAGRFAMSRTLIANPLIDAENLTADDMTAQEITVMQNHDGRTLLKVQATPIQRAGQNFDLSASGTQFAVLRGGNIEVYPLAALSAKDFKAVKLAEGMFPEPNDAPVKLNSVEVQVKEAEAEEVRDETKPVVAAAAAAAPVQAGGATELPASEAVRQSSAPANEEVLGDVEGAARQRPSLYTPEHPREKGDPVSSQKSETPQ